MSLTQVQLLQLLVKTQPHLKGVASFSGSYFTVTSGDVAIDDATQPGIASFNTNDFSVSNGAVSIGSLSNSQLDNNSVTFGTTEVALGATSTTLAGLTQLDVDNIRINGNTISNQIQVVFYT